MAGGFLGLLFSGVAASSPALGLEPTGCLFSSDVVRPGVKSETSSRGDVPAVAAAMAHLVEAARARARVDHEAERVEAGRAAMAITDPALGATPRRVETILDIAKRLNPDVLSNRAFDHFNETILGRLRPVRGQTTETDVGPIEAYLKAHYQFHVPGADRYADLDDLRARILNPFPDRDICPERRFFLLLALARHIGEKYDRPLARTQIEALRRDAEGLTGISRRDVPIRWSALIGLTEAAVDLEAFEWAQTWLADTIAEAGTLEAAGTPSEVVEEVRHYTRDFSAYVASEHADYRRHHATAAD